MFKLLLTWDIRPGKESEYFEFVTQEFVPKLDRLGLHPSEAWYTVYGNAPQILAGVVAEDRAAIDNALESSEWKSLTERLMTFITNFNLKIVPAAGNFQL